MARKISSIQKNLTLCGREYRIALLLVTALLVSTALAGAETAASKNSEGNSLYSEGRYEDAEKAYMEAQILNPDRPEILYNLGNTLVRQGKYPEGVQFLNRSSEKGDRSIQADSFYNTGNAMYSTGDFKGAAGAYIEALKRNPGDMDTKHNLELALRQMQQQKPSQKENKDNEKQEPGRESGKQNAENKGKEPQQPSGGQKQSGREEIGENSPKMKPESPVQREGSISREQALNILDALRNQELEQQRKRMESRPQSKTGEMDW